MRKPRRPGAPPANEIIDYMAHELPPLRPGLDFFPSQDPERPGLIIRDPYKFTDAILLVPPPLVASLDCFDGEKTELDLRASLVEATGEIQVGELEKQLLDTLSSAGFLDDEHFQAMRHQRLREFAEAPVRLPSHAGAAYPEGAPETRAELDEYLHGSAPRDETPLLGLAAPHVSPFGGWRSYREAYGGLPAHYRDRTFVILGTSHYGEPDRFGLTRKNFLTPLGEAVTDTALVSELASQAPDAVRMEDYCHSIEHSIEFQVLFLQHVFGPDIRILPILCGAFGRSLYQGGMPEDTEHVRRFFGALGELGARQASHLFWVLGIDMAHMGRRYGDPIPALAHHDGMTEVEQRDRRRIASVTEGDPAGFWQQVQVNQDDLKWCGSAPLYTFLKAVPQARGSLRHYEQWNIDRQSVVSFAALSFA